MTGNMNIERLLSIVCLLAFLAVGGKSKAQIVEKHRVGLDIRPGYVVPTNSFLEGDNLQQKAIEQSL